MNPFKTLLRHGPGYAVRETYHRLNDRLWEQRLGVRTSGNLACGRGDCHDYGTTHYRNLFRILKGIPMDLSEACFVDIGCGLGRAMRVAQICGCKKVIGLDFNPELARIAKRTCPDAFVLCADATRYTVPADANLLFLYNPFEGQVLRDTIDNIYDSLRLHPREIYIPYINHDWFDPLVEDLAWIKPLTDPVVLHPNHSYRLYKATM